MARWVEVPVRMRSIKDEESSNILGLPEMEVRTIIKPAMLDIDRVESYARMIDQEGESLEDQTDVWLQSGGYMVIQIPFKEFDKLVRGSSKKN